MESNLFLGPAKKDFVEALPPLIKYISSNEVVGFDSIEENGSLSNRFKESDIPSLGLPARETEAAVVLGHRNKPQPIDSQRMHCVSISMPSSPTLASLQRTNGAVFGDHNETIAGNGVPGSSSISIIANNTESKQAKFHSQPIPTLSSFVEANGEHFPHHTRVSRFKDRRYDSFKTWSGKLERQLSHLRGKAQEEIGEEDDVVQKADMENPPVDRYFDALEGPELETLKPSEKILLPVDKKWPFLLRFPISSFGICLGIGSQAILWKALATSASTKFLHVSLTINLILWCIAVFLIVIISSIYLLKVIFYFEAVRREYFHPIRVNFFFSPWIALLFLALGVPPAVCNRLHESLWYILMTPIFCLELKIYGQWMSGGQRRLSKVANPSNHLSIVGNFVGALLGASMGLKEGPIFFFAIGMAHYAVLFVTLYQRLPTNATLPKELHPVFFLFVAAPSVASMAWAKIQGSFDYGARIAYFIALFLYFSLAVRVNFFRGFRFSLAWWAYTFPMTAASVATIQYSNEVTTAVTQALSVILCALATLTVTALLINTIVHAFILRDLFPNDVGIAISERRPKTSKKWFHHLRLGSSDSKDIENFLKFACPDSKDTKPSNTDDMQIV